MGCRGNCRERESIGSNAIKVKADVMRRDEVGKMVELAVEEFGSVDVLVNNVDFQVKLGVLGTSPMTTGKV